MCYPSHPPGSAWAKRIRRSSFFPPARSNYLTKWMLMVAAPRRKVFAFVDLPGVSSQWPTTENSQIFWPSSGFLPDFYHPPLIVGLAHRTIQITTRGAGLNTSLLQNFELSPLTERGYVKVLPSLQLQSYPSKFAMEDITNLQDAKQYQTTAGHASVVVWTRFERAQLFGRRTKTTMQARERYLMAGWVFYFWKLATLQFLVVWRSATFSTRQSSQKNCSLGWRGDFEFIIGWICIT